MSLRQPVIWSMAAILRDSTVVVVVAAAAVVRTRPRAIPLAMITMRKSTHGFPFVSHIWVAYGAPLKYRAANFFRPIAAKSGRNKPPQKTVQKSLSQRKIMRELHSDEEKGLLMQYHSINIEKLPTRRKNKVSNIAK